MVLIVKDAETLAQAHSLEGERIVILIPDTPGEESELLDDQFDAMEEMLHKNIIAIPISYLPDLMEIEEGFSNLY